MLVRQTCSGEVGDADRHAKLLIDLAEGHFRTLLEIRRAPSRSASGIATTPGIGIH
jgi:hypothetical protein